MKLTIACALSILVAVQAAPKPISPYGELKMRHTTPPTSQEGVNLPLGKQQNGTLVKRAGSASCYGSGTQSNPMLLYRAIEDFCNGGNGRTIPANAWLWDKYETQPNSPSRSTQIIIEYGRHRHSGEWNFNRDECKQTLQLVVNSCRYRNREYEFSKGGTAVWFDKYAFTFQYWGRVDPQFEEIGRK